MRNGGVPLAIFCLQQGTIFQSYSIRPVGRAVTRSFLEREVGGSNLAPVKWDMVLPMARHRCNISLKGRGCVARVQ